VSPANPPKQPDPPSERNWALLVGAGFLVLLAAALVVAVGLLAEKRGLSPLETSLMAIIELGLSVAGSSIIADYLGRRRGIQTASTLARPALRRVLELNESAHTIERAITDSAAQIQDDAGPPPARVRDWLRSLEYLLSQHRGQLGAAIEDWRDLLPHEYHQFLRIVELENRLLQATQELHDSQADMKTLQDLREKVSDLDEQLSSVRRSAGVPRIVFRPPSGFEFHAGSEKPSTEDQIP